MSHNGDRDRTPDNPSDLFRQDGNFFKFFKVSVLDSSQQLEEQSKVVAQQVNDIGAKAERVLAQLETLENVKKWQTIRQFLTLLPVVLLFSGAIFWLGYQYGHDKGMGLAEFVVYATDQCGHDWGKEQPCMLAAPHISDH